MSPNQYNALYEHTDQQKTTIMIPRVHNGLRDSTFLVFITFTLCTGKTGPSNFSTKEHNYYAWSNSTHMQSNARSMTEEGVQYCHFMFSHIMILAASEWEDVWLYNKFTTLYSRSILKALNLLLAISHREPKGILDIWNGIVLSERIAFDLFISHALPRTKHWFQFWM